MGGADPVGGRLRGEFTWRQRIGGPYQRPGLTRRGRLGLARRVPLRRHVASEVVRASLLPLGSVASSAAVTVISHTVQSFR